MINEASAPLPGIHLQELLCWSCGDLLRLQYRLLTPATTNMEKKISVDTERFERQRGSRVDNKTHRPTLQSVQNGPHPEGMDELLITLLLSHHCVDWLERLRTRDSQTYALAGSLFTYASLPSGGESNTASFGWMRFIRTVMKTRRALGHNRRRQGDTDEWLKVRSLQSAGEGRLSGCNSAVCV
ncbi:Hypothetical predicted protein [Scomber scombrus]|uniref:Uncharacterized protein n=1 Tax=Scomber scombrus TaxID=13677 RepID=A0AAV1MS98_SCOSC